MHDKRSEQIILHEMVTLTEFGNGYKAVFISSLLGRNILLTTLFSNTLNLWHSLTVSHSYIATDKIIIFI